MKQDMVCFKIVFKLLSELKQYQTIIELEIHF